MSGGGYSFTTLSAHLGEPVKVGVGFYLDSAAWICAAGGESGRPQLAVSYGDVTVHFCPPPDQITPEAARVARRLADQAAKYAADVERLSTAQAEAPDSGASDEAAGDPAA